MKKFSKKAVNINSFDYHDFVIKDGKLIGEFEQLRNFYRDTAKTFCVGKCGRAEAVLQDTEFGQRQNIGEWICPPCHKKVCGVDVTDFHNCEALDG